MPSPADRRSYERYEIHFTGTVSGLSQGSPVRYLGVDVGRVRSLSVDSRNAGQVTVIAEIDSTAPISGATRAKLGLLGLTGLLYIDLQQDFMTDPHAPLQAGDRYPIIASQKGDIEQFLERLPDAVTRAANVMMRVEKVLSDENLAVFIGPRGEPTYRRKLAPFRDDPAFVPTWNWAAAPSAFRWCRRT